MAHRADNIRPYVGAGILDGPLKHPPNGGFNGGIYSLIGYIKKFGEIPANPCNAESFLLK